MPRLETYIKIAKALGIPKRELKAALLKDFETQISKAIDF